MLNLATAQEVWTGECWLTGDVSTTLLATLDISLTIQCAAVLMGDFARARAHTERPDAKVCTSAGTPVPWGIEYGYGVGSAWLHTLEARCPELKGRVGEVRASLPEDLRDYRGWSGGLLDVV